MKQTGVGLIRQLGPFDSTMIVVGVVVGAGIFITTGFMAKAIPSAGLILLAWIVGGLLTLAGALTYSELGAALPEAAIYVLDGLLPGAASLHADHDLRPVLNSPADIEVWAALPPSADDESGDWRDVPE